MGIKWIFIIILFFLMITIVALFIGVYILKYEMPGMNYIKAIIKNPLNLFLVLLFHMSMLKPKEVP
ncbi:MAG: hypothetical protein GX567_03285 [Clostridia bacterium]|nr:hypothetical protein [Clostridia bacterium]